MGATPRGRRARDWRTALRALRPEPAVPHSGLVRAWRRSTPALGTAPQLTAWRRAAQARGPRGARRPPTCATGIGVLARPGRRGGETIRRTGPAGPLDATPPV